MINNKDKDISNIGNNINISNDISNDINNNIDEIINIFKYIIKTKQLLTIHEIRKYIYTHDFEESKIRLIKIAFSYGESHAINMLINYINTNSSDKEELIKKIKGLIN